MIKKKRKKRFRIGDNEKEILKMLAGGAIIATALVVPNAALVFAPLFRHKRTLKKSIVKLEEKGLIYLGGERIVLTERGEKLSGQLQSREIVLEKDNWDGVWRVISYDVPNEFNKQRDYFRGVLKKLGFVKIQKSMWVVPWECKEEIAVIAHDLRLSPFVIYLLTDTLPGEKTLLDQFGIEK